MTPKLYFVKVSSPTNDYCLMYGPGTERWTGTEAQAKERAAALTATSYTKSVYIIEEAPQETP